MRKKRPITEKDKKRKIKLFNGIPYKYVATCFDKETTNEKISTLRSMNINARFTRGKITSGKRKGTKVYRIWIK